MRDRAVGEFEAGGRMKLLAFAVHDSKAGAWLRPFFAPSVGLAARALGEAVNDPAHEFCKYVEDFTLHQVGHFDEESGALDGSVNEVVCRLVTLKKVAGPQIVKEA